MRPRRLRESLALTSARSVTAAGAVALIALGAAPMAAASANRNADPVIAQAISGDSAALDQPAPAFRLTDQDNREVTLASLRGKVVLLTFLDPVCVSDCPLIAQEFRAAGQLLGPTPGRSSWSLSSSTRCTTAWRIPGRSTSRRTSPACPTGCT